MPSDLNPEDSKKMEELQKELDRLRLENEALKKNGNKPTISWKVSEKGAVSIYGLGRLPTTLYAQQWQRIFERSDDILKFIEENKSRLSIR